MTRVSTRELTLTAVMSAFVFIATFVPKIPIPLGYAHLGDAAIFIIVVMFGRKVGILSGCFGSMLADLIGGFPIWIGPTMIIKWLMTETFVRTAKLDENFNYYSPRTIAALILAGIVMAAGYTLTGALLYDSLEAGLSSAPGLLIEGLVNAVAAVFVGTAMLKYKQ